MGRVGWLKEERLRGEDLWEWGCFGCRGLASVFGRRLAREEGDGEVVRGEGRLWGRSVWASSSGGWFEGEGGAAVRGVCVEENPKPVGRRGWFWFRENKIRFRGFFYSFFLMFQNCPLFCVC